MELRWVKGHLQTGCHRTEGKIIVEEDKSCVHAKDWQSLSSMEAE